MNINILRIIADGLIIYSIISYCKLKKPQYLAISGFIIMLAHTLEIYFLYRGQENSDLFFAHAYFSYLICSFLIYIINKRFKNHFEHLVLLPLCVIPIISGVELCVGWILKLYARYLF